jgi:hypothetical protein
MFNYCFVQLNRTKSDSELCSTIVMFNLIELNQKHSQTNLKQIVELTIVELS